MHSQLNYGKRIQRSLGVGDKIAVKRIFFAYYRLWVNSLIHWVHMKRPPIVHVLLVLDCMLQIPVIEYNGKILLINCPDWKCVLWAMSIPLFLHREWQIVKQLRTKSPNFQLYWYRDHWRKIHPNQVSRKMSFASSPCWANCVGQLQSSDFVYWTRNKNKSAK